MDDREVWEQNSTNAHVAYAWNALSIDVIGLSSSLMQSSDDLHEVMPWLYAEAYCFACGLGPFQRTPLLCYPAHNTLRTTTRCRSAEKDKMHWKTKFLIDCDSIIKLRLEFDWNVLEQHLMTMCPTREPPMAELLMADNMGTILGSTALISAVGASNLGFTSTKYKSPLANKSCWMSKGFNPLRKATPTWREDYKAAGWCFISNMNSPIVSRGSRKIQRLQAIASYFNIHAQECAWPFAMQHQKTSVYWTYAILEAWCLSSTWFMHAEITEVHCSDAAHCTMFDT